MSTPIVRSEPTPAGDQPSRGGLAAWSVRHPIGVVMIALAVVVLGMFSLGRLGVDLLPHIIYPEVRVRVVDPGVPGVIMEDQVSRQLEEQLAVTEDAVGVQSRTSEGRSEVDLTFSYGKDIDIALRDASTRLDRAKRFLPDTIDPPIIYKRDPSQIPVMEYVISSRLRDPVELRIWIDYVFANWFVNLPGVAAVEVGGAPFREVLVLPDQQRLAGHGLSLDDVIAALEGGNLDVPGGPLRMARQEISGRTTGRFTSVEQIAGLPIPLDPGSDDARLVRLQDVADVIDGNADERLRIRLNGAPGLKVSVQKQPQANTVAVADGVKQQIAWLQEQQLLPEDVRVDTVSDQSIYVRQALKNASGAALSGAMLAMLVVYLFLGDIRRTLIIGTGIPIAIMVALMLMASVGLTLNIMTLGGLALGVGMLVDNTIVMLENVYRHQRMGKSADRAPVEAAAEVNSAIVASTSTNLAAVLPFLFIGGLVGLLFSELIATISAAIVASLVVALTLVPALGARVPVSDPGWFRRLIDTIMTGLQSIYARMVALTLRGYWFIPIPFVAALVWALPTFQSEQQIFLPSIDDGRVYADIVADAGISLNEMDRMVAKIETLMLAQPEVESAFSQIGGYVFGRSEYQRSNRSRVAIQLVPLADRQI
ncbi:MAG: efflux RND transporter permease subunit, partial [Gammaproteobacteria bacterium]|nr:efflux RND transporter permease subunit [Gammaproteobacteria bacterium]